jgi:hypothetical protein
MWEFFTVFTLHTALILEQFGHPSSEHYIYHEVRKTEGSEVNH